MVKIVNKNGLAFAVGMLWQIPDYGKKSISLAKVLRDTGCDLYCWVNNIKTFGFGTKSALKGYKKVASLGKFIIESAKITANYPPSIICYKFKASNESSGSHKGVEAKDTYGYVVLINGTVLPLDGEYVGELDIVRNLVLEKARIHQIETLYLPIDVADKFLNIFERLDYAYHSEDEFTLLIKIIEFADRVQIKQILEFVLNNFANNQLVTLRSFLESRMKMQLLDQKIEGSDLRELVTHAAFRQKLKDNVQVDNNVRYLFTNVFQVPLSSSEIFWNKNLKINHSKALLKTIKSLKFRVVRALGMVLLIVLPICLWQVYNYLNVKAKAQNLTKHIVSAPKVVPATILITGCLGNGHDKLFRDLKAWTLVAISCSSYSAKYTFKRNNSGDSSDLAQILGVNAKVQYKQNQAVYNVLFPKNLSPNKIKPVDKKRIRSTLIDGSNQFAYQLSWRQNKQNSQMQKFIIKSTLSPVFLYQHNIINQVLLKNIGMQLNQNTGEYNWQIDGEI